MEVSTNFCLCCVVVTPKTLKCLDFYHFFFVNNSETIIFFGKCYSSKEIPFSAWQNGGRITKTCFRPTKLEGPLHTSINGTEQVTILLTQGVVSTSMSCAHHLWTLRSGASHFRAVSWDKALSGTIRGITHQFLCLTTSSSSPSSYATCWPSASLYFWFDEQGVFLRGFDVYGVIFLSCKNTIVRSSTEIKWHVLIWK